MGRRTAVVVLAATTGALLLAGCGAVTSDGSTEDGDAYSAAAPSPGLAPEAERAAAASAPPGAADIAAASSADRAVVRTADLSVRVEDVAAAADAAIVTVRDADGSLSYEQRSGSPGREEPDADLSPGVMPLPGPDEGARATLTFRVPPAVLDAVLDDLGQLGTVESRSQQATDVSEQVVDLDARIAALTASTERLRSLLARAESVADIAAIEAELTEREAQLQSLRAQQRSLDDRVSAATVTLHLFDAPAAGEVEPGGFLGGLQSGWDAFVTGLGWAATGIGAALPFVLLIGVPVGAVVMVVRHRRVGPESVEADSPAT